MLCFSSRSGHLGWSGVLWGSDVCIRDRLGIVVYFLRVFVACDCAHELCVFCLRVFACVA